MNYCVPLSWLLIPLIVIILLALIFWLLAKIGQWVMEDVTE